MHMYIRVGCILQKYSIVVANICKSTSNHIKRQSRVSSLEGIFFKIIPRCKTASLTVGLAGVVRVVEDHDIRKSKSDKRKYRGLELKNGMKVLLVHDPSTDKAAMAVDVHVGCMVDPRALPGLAHLCEHMLFLGTTKYPREDEFRSFLSAHGGSFNASTGLEHTNYHVTLSAQHLQPAFDRFVQFFISPLFKQDVVEREINAVDNEHRRNLQTDAWRLMQLRRSLAREDHDLNKFGSGNKNTLDTEPKRRGVDVRDALLTFHRSFYSANIMGVCVLGRHSLDELTDMVLRDLLKVDDKRVDIPRWDSPPYSPSSLPRLVSVVPVKDVRQMTVTWPVPDVSTHFREKPVHYLSHLFGHEGKGSLLSELKARGWAMSLTAGGSTRGATGFGFFDLTLTLTEKGQDHVEDILGLIYQYVHLLSSHEPQEWLFDEIRKRSNIQFDFKDKERAQSFASFAAKHLQTKPMKDILCFPYLVESFNPKLIKQVLSKMSPKNMMVFVLSKKFEGNTDKTEKWYGTRYKIDTFSDQQLAKMSNPQTHEKLHFPERNKFIPDDFNLVPREDTSSKHPVLIRDSPSRRLWFKQDNKYMQPKVAVNLSLSNPLAYVSPRHAVMNYLFVRLFHESFAEVSYMADLGGLHYSVTNTVKGLTVTVKGFSDKLNTFLETLVNELTTLSIDAEKLAIFKDDYDRKLVNFNADQPYHQANFYVSHLILNSSWSIPDLHAAIDKVSVEDLETFGKDMLSKLHIEGLVYGNATAKDTLNMFDKVDSILSKNRRTKPLDQSRVQKSREIRLPEESYFIRKEDNCVHENYGTELYLQCGEQSPRNNAVLELIAHMIKEPCFSILRTREQLGYIVFSGVRRSHGCQGLRFLVQSAVSSEYVEYRIEAFIEQMSLRLQNMSEEIFQMYKNSLIKARLRTAKNINDQNTHYWNEITKGTYHFDRDIAEANVMKAVTKDDVIQYYKENLQVAAKNRKKLVVHVIPEDKCSVRDSLKQWIKRNLDLCEGDMSKGDGDGDMFRPPVLPRPTYIHDVAAFKRMHGLYPAPKPYINLSELIK